MPVGSCLGSDGTSTLQYGGGHTSSNNGNDTPFEVVMTSAVLNTAEQFAFMQQTLLMQIFRVPSNQSHYSQQQQRSSPQQQAFESLSSSASSSSSNSGGGGGGSGSGGGRSSSSGGDFMPVCPTCIAFSDQCCQLEAGMVLFHEFLEANLQWFWDAKLSEALGSLR